jgi:hypothetical protein
MNLKQVNYLKYGSVSTATSSVTKPERDKFLDLISGNKGINRTRESVSLLASLDCILKKLPDGSYRVKRKVFKRNRQVKIDLGTYKRSEFFELALTLNPELGKN